MGYIVGVPYYAITEEEYQDLSALLPNVSYLQDFARYEDPSTHAVYYLALQSSIDSNEEAMYNSVGFPIISFGIAYFTTSVQANITMP